MAASLLPSTEILAVPNPGSQMSGVRPSFLPLKHTILASNKSFIKIIKAKVIIIIIITSVNLPFCCVRPFRFKVSSFFPAAHKIRNLLV